jgi:hypothetical protein
MNVRCPQCGATFQAEVGPVTCPSCMHSFTVAPEGRPWLTLDVRRPSGELLGRMDRHLVRERLYAGALTGLEQVRPAGHAGAAAAAAGDWVDLNTRPEFAEVLQLIGADLGARRIAQQQLRGWRKTGSAVMPVRSSAPAERAVGRALDDEPKGRVSWPLLAVAAALVLGIVALLWGRVG